MKRKIIPIVTSILLIMTLTSCAKSEEQKQREENVKDVVYAIVAPIVEIPIGIIKGVISALFN